MLVSFDPGVGSEFGNELYQETRWFPSFFIIFRVLLPGVTDHKGLQLLWKMHQSINQSCTSRES